MSADQTPLDVEAIRAELAAMAGRPWTAEAAEYFIGRLLDENARLNAELSDFREMAVLNTKSLSRALDEARAELDKVIREAAADKAKLDAKVADLEAQIEAGRRVEKGEPCPECGGTVSPWRDVWGKVGFHACTTCTWPLPGPDGTPRIAPEMPRPPAEEADAEYMVVIPSLCGNPTDYRMSYSSDRVRKSTREAAIAHGLEVEGHDDWLIAIVVGDKLTGLAWQHEDRDDAEEVEEAAAALGLTAAFAMPIPAAQEPVSGPETAGTGSGRGTGITEAQKASRAIELDPTEGMAIEIEHPLLGDTIETEYLGETNGTHRWRLTNPAVGANSITFPSLPVPSTADYRHEPEGA